MRKLKGWAEYLNFEAMEGILKFIIEFSRIFIKEKVRERQKNLLFPLIYIQQKTEFPCSQDKRARTSNKIFIDLYTISLLKYPGLYS